MNYWYLVFFIGGGAVGALLHRAIIDGLMLGQEAAHEKEKEWMWDEMKRLRAQVAGLIGQE